MAPGGFGSKSTPPGAARTSQPRSSTPTSSPRQNQPSSNSEQNGPRIIRSPVGAEAPQRRQRSRAGPPSKTRKNEEADDVTEAPVAARTGPGEGVKLVNFLSQSSDQAADIEAMRLAKEKPLRDRFRAGHAIRFASEEEKQRVLSAARPKSKGLVEGKESYGIREQKLEQVPEKVRDALGAKIVAGKYEALKSAQSGKTVQERTMAHLKTSMQLNGTYNAAARQAMLDFMGNKWPGQARAKAS